MDTSDNSKKTIVKEQEVYSKVVQNFVECWLENPTFKFEKVKEELEKEYIFELTNEEQLDFKNLIKNIFYLEKEETIDCIKLDCIKQCLGEINTIIVELKKKGIEIIYKYKNKYVMIDDKTGKISIDESKIVITPKKEKENVGQDVIVPDSIIIENAKACLEAILNKKGFDGQEVFVISKGELEELLEVLNGNQKKLTYEEQIQYAFSRR